MKGSGLLRWLRVGVLAGSGAGVLALASMLTAAAAFGTDETALIMGGSGIPIPPPIYITDVNDSYLQCYPPVCTPQGLFTPEGLYPMTGVKQLPFDTSVAQGVTILNDTLQRQLATGTDVTVFGWSQSSTVSSLEMANIVNGSAGIHPDPGQLSFVLVGDPNNPNGGMFERFDLIPGVSPSMLGTTFSGATPVTEYPTTIYTGEYDAVGDYPRYPLNLLSDLNAMMGFVFVHTQYPTLTPDQLATAVPVPTSLGYDGATTYYMIPTENLPLLDPLRSIPVVGPVMADLLQPDLKVLVNLGYGDPAYGWVNADANVPTPIGLFPSLADLEKVPGLLAAGTAAGISKAVSDLESPAQLFSLADNPVLNLLQNPVLDAIAATFLPSTGTSSGGLMSVVNAFSGAASSLYSAFLPTADVINSLITTMPAYDVGVFFSELAAGNLIDAIGLPIAADVGMLPMTGLSAFGTFGEASLFAAVDLISPFVDVASLIP